MSENNYAVIVEHLVKTYNKGEVKAVNDISFKVEKGFPLKWKKAVFLRF